MREQKNYFIFSRSGSSALYMGDENLDKNIKGRKLSSRFISKPCKYFYRFVFITKRQLCLPQFHELSYGLILFLLRKYNSIPCDHS